MRGARITVPAEEGPAVYHVMTRTVNAEKLFDHVAKEVLRQQLWRIADFCGVEILTYAILANHFHILVRIPQRTVIPDEELLRRYRVLYPRPTRYQTARLDVIRAQLATNGPDAVGWRRRQLALMGNLSQYMKLLKQRFSIWFNKTHRRCGTLWSERFKSVLVQGKKRLLQTIAAYIDLNCVRANLVEDPKDYRFCGYAEAVAGSPRARAGIGQVTGEPVSRWSESQCTYRLLLFGTASAPRARGRSLPLEHFLAARQSAGQLPLTTILHCRVRYFSDGAVLGTQAFVATALAALRRKGGSFPRTGPRRLPAIADWGDLAVLRRLRRVDCG
ncbi:MAG: transposase [Opitutaceae bacterium]|nr:transposase [Opitutaceae bacterium]